LIEFSLLVLEEKISVFKIFSVFLLFRYYLPLKKGYPLHLNKLESPPSKDELCQVCLNWSSGSGEEVENVKVYRRTDRQTHTQTDRQTNGRRTIRKAHLSFQLRWAKNTDVKADVKFLSWQNWRFEVFQLEFGSENEIFCQHFMCSSVQNLQVTFCLLSVF
jgi:hypothetical protein